MPNSTMIPFPIVSIVRSIPRVEKTRGRARLWGLALAGLWLLTLAGASDPEIVRVRVPAKEVSRWFPAGTELE